MLDWREDYVDQKVAETPRGTYRVDDADSLGRREVTLTTDHGEYFIGSCMLSTDGMEMAERHARWVSTLNSKEPGNAK